MRAKKAKGSLDFFEQSFSIEKTALKRVKIIKHGFLKKKNPSNTEWLFFEDFYFCRTALMV